MRGRRRRWPWVVGPAIGGLIAGAAAFWFVWVPQYRPDLRAGERYGIDVSHHQGVVDWERVAGDDIEFAYVKATEGGDFTDRQFTRNWKEAGRVGIDRGAYHFFTLCRAGDVQARHFLDLLPDDAALPPAVDLELKGNCSARPADKVVQRELQAFLDAVEAATGQRTLLYVGDEWERRYPVRDRLDRPLWHRRFLRRPNVDGWVVWQVSGFAHVDGIDGDVDLDVMRSPASQERP